MSLKFLLVSNFALSSYFIEPKQKNAADNILSFNYFSVEIRLDISCELSA